MTYELRFKVDRADISKRYIDRLLDGTAEGAIAFIEFKNTLRAIRALEEVTV